MGNTLKELFKDIVIDVPDRFIGKYNNYRISIVLMFDKKQNNPYCKAYNTTIEKDNIEIIDNWDFYSDINVAIYNAIRYINSLKP